MNRDAAKYSRIEYARRFVVAPEADWKRFAEPFSKRHEDKYLNGTRLRIRIQTDSDSNRRLIKLTKKYESESAYFRQINTILLTPEELEIFDRLAGERVAKTRFYHRYKNRIFSIDVFENDLRGLLICETEQPTLEDLTRAEPPPYALSEVTENPFFTGANLAEATAAELSEKLSALK